MNSKLEPQTDVDIIYQSIEEVHTLLSTMEEQIKQGSFPAQPETETIETATSQEKTFVLEKSPFSNDWFDH